MALYVRTMRQSMILYKKIAMEFDSCRSLTSSAVCSISFRSRDRAPTLRALKNRADYMKEKGLWPEYKRSEFLDWNYDAEVYAFGKRLQEEFDETAIREALTDPAYIREETERLKTLGLENTLSLMSNEALAEAGRALARDFIMKYLRTSWPSLPEEGIESVTEYLTSDETLGRVGEGIGLKDLIMSKEYPPSMKTYAASLFAVIAALNLSSGLERTYLFIQDFVLTQLVGKDIWDVWHIEDPMTVLKGILRTSGRGDPEPRVIADIGRNTIEAVFHIGIYSDKEFVGSGYGDNTDVGIHVAALDCLSRIFSQTLRRDPLPVMQDITKLNLKSTANTHLKDYTLKSLS